MSGHETPDPLDQLRRANPADVDQLPSASLARVQARIRENVMTHSNNAPRTWRSRLTPLTMSVGAGVAAMALAFVVLGSAASPRVGPAGSNGPQVGACVETYSLATLGNRSFAFDGTVTAVSGDEVTFRVNDSFQGPADQEVTLSAVGMTGRAITPGGGPTLSVGERFLVAGDDRFAWACGFTQAYDAGVAASWADALGS